MFESLKYGDEIRIICPSGSFTKKDKIIVDKNIKLLEEAGFKVSLGKYVYDIDEDFKCAAQSLRIKDLMDAFLDKNVKAIICGKGGFNVNQLLPNINYELIKQNPKIICGFSDNTALLIAIYTKCNFEVYLGPNFLQLFDNNNWQLFKECVMNNNYLPQNNKFISDTKEMKGIILGGNLCTLNLLQGTEFLCEKKKVILLLEDDDNYKEGAFYREFTRNLTSFLQCNIWQVVGLIFGSFSNSCFMTEDKIKNMVKFLNIKEDIPVIINFDVGHIGLIRTIKLGDFISLQEFDK